MMEKKVWFARFACAVALGLLCCGVHGGVVDLNVPTDYSSGGFYRYCPATLVEGGVRHVFYCKNTTANQIVDSIYHATVDAAGNLSGESAVLDPADSTGNAWDSYHVCDPSVIKGAFVYNNHTYAYMMAYLGVQGRVGDTESDGYRAINNKVGLAVSDSLDSGWVRMGTNAVVVTDKSGTWGVGQPSLVSLDNAGKVALFYAGDYGTRMLALDFTDAAKTTASLAQKVGSEGSPVSKDGVSDLAGTTTKMTITNADFAYNPSTGRLYMIADTPDRADSWYDDGGQNLYITKAVTVYGCTLYALNANSVTNAIWHQQMRIQPADLDGSTLATSARVTNSGLVRTPYGDIAEKTAMVTVANVVPNALYTYRFMPVDWSVNEATDDPYIQSVRLNTYINTGYYPNPTTRVELDYALVEPGDDAETSQARIMDNGGTSSTLPMTFYIAGQPGSGSLSTSFFFGDHTSGWDGTLTTQKGTSTARKNYLDEVRRTAIIDNPNKTVALAENGVRIWECARTDYTFANTSTYPLGLCAAIGNQYGTSADRKCKMRVYGLKIYESDVLVHDFVPYLQAGWPGLRDTKTGLFVSDDRVDAFAPVYGGNIESGDDPFIASAGHSVVNTRYLPQPKTRIEVDFALAEDNGQATAILSEIASGHPSVHLYVQNTAEKYLAIGFGDSWNVHNDIRFTSGVRRRKAIIDGPNGTLAFITGATTNKIKTGVADIVRTGPYPVGMFACITNAASDLYDLPSKSKIYSCRIWIDGALAHDYKPCVKGGVAGFKDLVDGAFVMSEAKTEDERLSYGGDVLVEPDDGYLEASGINQVIDTGYKCTTKTRIEADFALTTIKSKNEVVDGRTLSNNVALFGVWNDKVNLGFYNNGAHTHSWMGQTNTTDWTDSKFRSSLARRTVVIDGPAAKRVLITEGFTNKVASMKWGGDLSGQYSLPIFTLRDAGTIRSDFYPFVKLYGFRIYEDGVLQKNLVPCVKSGIPGLRDTVSGGFLTSGDGAYRPTAGGNIEQIDGEEGAYVESDGTQAVSTGYRMKNTSRVEADFRLLGDMWNGSVVFGANASGENRVLGCYLNGDFKHMLLLGLYGSKWAVQNVGSNDLQRHTAVIDAPNKQFYLVSGSTTNTFAIPNNYSSATTATDPIALFGCITNGVISRATHARVYAFRIYEEGVLKHHYLPYWNGEEAGFYDVADPDDPVKLKFGDSGHPLTIGGCGWGEENAAFYTAPHDTNLREGQTVTLEAFAPGAVAYQWYCDGEPIDGATGQTLDVSWRKSKEPAVYTARATFSRFGVPFTRDASATVTSLPKGLILSLM